MKTKSVNSIIFVISAIVFFLQVVGYFAPAWFVQEVVFKHDLKGIFADDRRFRLPYVQNSKLEEMSASVEPVMEDGIVDEKFLIGGQNIPPKDVISRKRRTIQRPEVTNIDFSSGNDCDMSDNQKCSNKLINKGKNSTSITSGNGVSSPDKATSTSGDEGKGLLIKGPSTDKIEHDAAKSAQSDSTATSGSQVNMMKPGSKNKTASLLYITAGLWYSRACITTREYNTDDDDGNSAMQWCTLYSRFDDNTLEKRMNIFELRIEATLGIVFSALCLLISSTACCSHRHHGRRAISSLTSLFISGAITAVPVVHIIIQHVQIHDKILRSRKWIHLTKMLHVQHDLFDHYSVILCGVASVISVLSAVIITIISCRSNSKPDNWYNLNRVQEEKESKHELPINWVHNSKITVPPVSEVKDETKDESESGYSEVKDDIIEEGTSSVHDGGSVGNDDDTLEFDPKEMTTFDM